MTQPMNPQPPLPTVLEPVGEPAGGSAPTRRDVMDYAIGVVAATAAVAAAYPAVRFLSPVPTGKGGPVTLRLADVPKGTVTLATAGERSVLVVHNDEGAVRAFSATCPHLGCGLRWDEDERLIRCGCHGGRFGMDGRVVSGPPPRALTELTVDMVGDKVVVT
ncbi:MAG: Rieske (2Fe-2S) protein [Myxococcales bacterium]|nr:Rieske (2Fe-2S) protein [Myxococcales bacterium]